MEDLPVMAQQEGEGKKKSWLAMALTTLGGLLSGAAVMYLTPLVDKVVKPARPLANFSSERDGLSVRFHNLATNGQGWLDFGDGSPLEPVSPEREFISHTYAHPGDYTVKMSLSNVLGDENERTVTLHLDTPSSAGAPRVDSLEALPLSAVSCAPATFRLVCKVTGAQLCVLDPGDGRPVEVSSDLASGQDHLVTFPAAGDHVVKVVALNGTQHDERTARVKVLEAPANTVTAVLTVTDQATRMDVVNRRVNLLCSPADRTAKTSKVNRTEFASTGSTITALEVECPNGSKVRLGGQTDLTLDCPKLGFRSASNLRLQLEPDRKTLHLTGDLVRDPASKDGGLLPVLLPATFVEQKPVAVPSRPFSVAAALALPAGGVHSSATLTLPQAPPNWVDLQRKVQIDLREGQRVVWQESQLPSKAVVVLHNRRCFVTVTRVDDRQVRVELADAPPGLNAAAN
jgi:PKD repeat protein